MAGRARLIQTHFTGEISRAARARADLDIYAGALELCRNYVARPSGKADRRPGGVVLGVAAAASKSKWFVLKKASNDAVRIEAGGGVFRFWNSLTRTLILNGGSPVTVAIPWSDDDLNGLRSWQQGDVMWFAHTSRAYPVYALRRTAANAFALSQVVLEEGPFVDRDSGAPVLTFSAVSGSVTVTAASAVFNAAHVGALIRCEATTLPDVLSWSFDMKVAVGEICRNGNRFYQATATNDPHRSGNVPPVHESGRQWDGNIDDCVQWEFRGFTYGLLRITAYTSPTQVTATVLRRLPFYGSASLTTDFWQISAISADRGYPACGTLFEERQCLFGSAREPDRSFLSRTTRWTPLSFDMRPGFVTETLEDDAIRRSIAGSETAAIVWAMVMDGLTLGSTAGVYRLAGPSVDEPLSPAACVPRVVSSVPCSELVPAVKADNSLLYLAPAEEELIELRRDASEDPRNLLEVASHMAGGGLRSLAWQGRPHRVLWGVDRRGRLVSMTYSPENSMYGWSLHRLGGRFGRKQPIVEDICSGPGPDGRDEIWLTVKRTVNGSTSRTVEYLERPFDTNTMRAEDACCLDAAGYYNLWQSYTVLAELDEGLVKLTAQSGTPFTSGDVGREFWLSANEDLPDEDDEPFPVRLRIEQQVNTTVLRGRLEGEYSEAAWRNRILRVARPTTSISGLSWLEGEEVFLNADGRKIGPLTVQSGSVSLVSPAYPSGFAWTARGWIGLAYPSLMRSLPVNGGEGLGSSRTATGKVSGIGVLPDAIAEGIVRRVDQAVDRWVDLNPRRATSPIGMANPPLTEDTFIPLDTGYDTGKQIEILASGPLPCSISGLVLKVESHG